MGETGVKYVVAALVVPPKRLSLVGVPPEQDVRVGDVFQVAALVESTVPVDDVAISFDEELFELITPGRTISVRAEAREFKQVWTLYAKAAGVQVAVVEIRARAAGLQQTAELRVRINAEASC